MIDDATIQKLGEEYARVMIGLDTLLEDELNDEHYTEVGAAISGHLIHIELGRGATREEYPVLIEHMERVLGEFGGLDPPAPRPGMTEQELRNGMLQSIRGALGEYALMLRHCRWVRQHRGWEVMLPTPPRVMAKILVGPSGDPDLAHPIAEAIVKRIGELVVG